MQGERISYVGKRGKGKERVQHLAASALKEEGGASLDAKDGLKPWIVVLMVRGGVAGFIQIIRGEKV